MVVAIIGAGPTGLHMAIELARKGIAHVVFEKGQIGQTIFNWPSHTRFHSAPERIQIGGLPIHSDHQERLSRDTYLSYLRQVVVYFKINVRSFEEVISVEKNNQLFYISSKNIHEQVFHNIFTHLIFATGSCHQPVVLPIPGIHLPHVKDVTFPLHHVFQRDILVVGGRHSALEYAIKAYRIGASKVSICSRGDLFAEQNLKKDVMDDMRKLVDQGNITLFSKSLVLAIDEKGALLQNTVTAAEMRISIHWLIIACGYDTSFELFKQMGIVQVSVNGAPLVNESTMETHIERAYVIGTAIAGAQQSRYEYFIENTLGHVEKVSAHIQKNTH